MIKTYRLENKYFRNPLTTTVSFYIIDAVFLIGRRFNYQITKYYSMCVYKYMQAAPDTAELHLVRVESWLS